MVEHVKVLVDHIEVALEQLFSTALMMYNLDVTITRSTASSWEPERARRGPKAASAMPLDPSVPCFTEGEAWNSMFHFLYQQGSKCST